MHRDSSRYSSSVSLNLRVNRERLPLSQVGPGYAILRKAIELPPCNAELVVCVDGKTRTSFVRLVDGAQPFDETVRMVRCVGEPGTLV